MLPNLTTRSMKFYNIDAPEVPTTTTAPSIAELMARGGHFAEAGYSDNLSDSNKQGEPTTPPPATEPPSVATTTETPQAETASQSTPTPEISTVEEPTPIAEVPKPEKTWQEVLKQQPDQRLVLNELGYDDKLVGLLNAIKDNPTMIAFYDQWVNNGDVTTFLREANTDYSKMTAEDVMRRQLREEYPKATPQQLEVLYRREVEQAYNLNSDDELEVNEGRMLLEAKAERYRDQFIDKQKNYLLPKPPEPKVSEPDNTEEIKAQQEAEAVKTFINDHAYTKDVVAKNRIAIGEGEDTFNYPVNAKEVLDLVMDSEKWTNAIYTKTDKGFIPKVEEQLLIGAFAKNPKKFLNEYAKHLKALGGQQAIAPIENAKLPEAGTPSQSEAAITNPAAAMAKFGRLS